MSMRFVRWVSTRRMLYVHTTHGDSKIGASIYVYVAGAWLNDIYLNYPTALTLWFWRKGLLAFEMVRHCRITAAHWFGFCVCVWRKAIEMRVNLYPMSTVYSQSQAEFNSDFIHSHPNVYALASSIPGENRRMKNAPIFVTGYRESAFAYAISAAGVVHSIVKACSQGHLMSCGCYPYINRKNLIKMLRSRGGGDAIDSTIEKRNLMRSLDDNRIEENKIARWVLRGGVIHEPLIFICFFARLKTTSRWKWGGCSHNMNFGIEFSELFLDAHERAADIQSKINLHNNHVGRMVILFSFYC